MKSILILCIAQILLVDMLQSLSINDLYACPERALWRMRADFLCANKTKQYHCLFDTFYRRYDEFCLSSRPFKSGLRIVFSGDLHAEDCRNPRYSPISVVSNDSAECNFLTSNCKEEGQVIVDNATSNRDITCRCDYTKGYNYITQPKDPCKCSPVEEDCSCYFNACPGIGYILNRDYHCVNRILKNFTCPILERSRYGVSSSSNATLKNIELDKTGPTLSRHTQLLYTLLCVITIIAVSIFIWWWLNSMKYSTCFRIDEKIRKLSKQWENPDKNKTGIFRQITDMKCMQFYQPTKQIQDMETKLEDRSQSALLILEGFSGSGKTQAAYHFCSKMRNNYSIIAKITANDQKSVIDSLKKLAIKLRISIPNQDENLCEQLCNYIGKFLNHDHHRGCSYLFFVDNVVEMNDQLSHVLTLKSTVKGLHVIVATVNSKIHTYFDSEPLVEFNGMENNEILQLFKSEPPVKVSNNQIEDLITVIGNIPLVVYVAKQYIITQKHTVEKYIEIFKDLTGEYALEKFKAHNILNKHIIQSQLLPLQQIQKHLRHHEQGDLWDLVGYLPYLQYSSVSNEVLEACYYHSCQTNYTQPLGKLKIDMLTNQFSTFSIHHSETNLVRRMSDKPITDKPMTERESKNSFLTFHELTMSVLDLIENKNEKDTKLRRRKRHSRSYFLLKMFCFEIDIDARTDVTLDRNMQFLPHAEKLLNELVFPDEKKNSQEVKFYLSYLNCAIGSTLLYQRNDVELAHKYLLKSRSLCLELVMNKPDLFAINPPTENDIQQILDASFSQKFDSNFVLEFVKNKRRSESEKDVICEEIGDLNLFHEDKKKSFKYHYLNDNGLYEKLLKNNIALPAKDISETFLYELVQRILHNNSRAWNELRYITTDETTETFRKASHSEVVFSNSLCRLRKKKYKYQNMFVCLESDRSGRMLECWTRDQNLFNEVDDDISFYKTMIRAKSNNYFDFGILKLSPRVNDRHIAMCRRILLWFLERKYLNQENQYAKTTFEDGKTVLEELQNQIKQMQTIKYTWLPLPLLHIQCAKFLRLSSLTSDLTKAEHLFRKAILLEESRGVSWSRFMWEGYVGALDCVKKSKKQIEEKEIIEEVKEKLTGTNRKDLIEKLTETNTF